MTLASPRGAFAPKNGRKKKDKLGLSWAKLKLKMNLKSNLGAQVDDKVGDQLLARVVGRGWWKDIYEIRANLNSVVVEVKV